MSSGDLEVEQKLVAVIVLAEGRNGGQLMPVSGSGPNRCQARRGLRALSPAVRCRTDRTLDAVLRAFDERHAVPAVFVRAVAARLGFTAGPARYLDFCAPRREPRVDQAVFDGVHRAARRLQGSEV